MKLESGRFGIALASWLSGFWAGSTTMVARITIPPRWDGGRRIQRLVVM
jgi:hypothetical protein